MVDGGSSGTVSRHRVGQQLQELILSGHFKPGEKLPQVELSKRFGVGRGVIRESLLELKACGLVEAVDNLGVFVSHLDAAKLIQASEIREVLEGLAARLCCERCSREDIRELRNMAHQIYELGSAGKAEEMTELDRKFHLRVIQKSGNDILERLTESYRVFGKMVNFERDPNLVRDEHLGILDSIENNQLDEAEKRMREHICVGRRIIEEENARGKFVPHWMRSSGQQSEG